LVFYKMENEYESKYHKIENDYWWFIARRDIIYKLLQNLNISKNSEILEIGCSGGVLLEFLRQNGFQNLSGLDISKKAIDLCKRRNLKNTFVMDALKPNLNKTYDVIIASDVLEHLEDDSQALSEWNKLLKVNGKLLVFVPAFNFLWSSHDVVNKHYRRYSKKQLTTLLSESNFKIIRASYWNLTLFYPISIYRIFSRIFNSKQKKDQMFDVSYLTNKILLILVRFENKILEKINFPVGVSFFVIVEK
tara:strand:+ start:631 stop:1374 length:744 start_codon:yes stop_codon:yes gene_type:complete